jgi:hypothetical protein
MKTLKASNSSHFPALKNPPGGLWFVSVDMNIYTLDVIKATVLENMTALSLTAM